MMAKTLSFEEFAGTPAAGEIPKGEDLTAPAPTRGEESDFGRVMRKAGEAAAAVGPVGVAAGGAMRTFSRAPQLFERGAGTVERGGRLLAEALLPKTGKQLIGVTTGAGAAGGAAELGRQQAEKAGAGPVGQQLAETTAAFAPTATNIALKRALAPGIEKIGKALYTTPQELRTPAKTQLQQQLTEADIRLLPSELRESRGLKAFERILQLIPSSAPQFIEFGKKNQSAVNLAVAKAFGGTEVSLVPAAMETARKDLTNAYGKLLDQKQFSIPDTTVTNLKNVFNQNEQLRELAVGNAKVSQFASALDDRAAITGKLWKEVRSEIARYVARLEGPSKLTGAQVLKQFDDIAQKNLPAKEYEQLVGIDRSYAALKAFEDAFARNPSLIKAGDVDLQKFAQQYASVEPMNVLYGRTAGRGGEFVPLTEAAQAYRVFTQPRVPETQATTLGGLGRAVTGLGLYGGGFAALPTLPELGIAAMAAPTLAGKASRVYLQPQATAKAMREATFNPYAAVPMFNPEKEQK
jgi:hypothetical protein